MKIKSFFILLLACALLFAGCKVETDAPDSPASPAPSAAPTDFVLYRADSFRIGSQAYEKCSFNEDISKKYAALIGKAADALAGETQVYCLVIPTAYGVLLPDDMKELIPDYSDMETNISSIYAALPDSVEPVPGWDKLRDHSGEYRPVTGNQTGVLLLDYLIGAMRRSGKMPEKPVALKTIVTTEMARKVAESNGVTCYDTFTGFKFMAEKKNALEAAGEGKVIFSYEESYGYMLGDYVRDKDAVTASMLLTEMAAWYAAQGMTLFDALEKLYEKYGHYAEKTYNLVMPGLDGLKDMAQLMKNLRENPPAEISGVKVVTRKDYTDGSVVDCATGAKSAMELSGSNVLRFELADGTTILVRPSGTEPKIKVYILTQGADSAACDANLEKYGQWVKTLQK